MVEIFTFCCLIELTLVIVCYYYYYCSQHLIVLFLYYNVSSIFLAND